MSKILLFNIPATGHVNPSLPLVKELVQRGEEIIYVNTEEYRAKIEATGARYIEYPDLSKLINLIQQDAGEGNIPRNMRDLVRVSADIFPFVLDLVEREKPDFLVYDSLASWGKVAAQKLKLKSIALLSTFAISPSALPPMPLPMILDTMGKMLSVLPSYWADAIQFRSANGLFPVFLVDAVMSTGDLNLVFTSKEFQPSGDKFAENYRFVGTSIAPRVDTSNFPFDKLTGSPLVYISLGTIAQNPEFIRLCFELFGKEKGQFILSAGKSADSAATVPDNFIVRSFVPQLEILQKVDAFITHGGLNSIHEGLTYGVPMVAVPQQMEQAIVANEVEKHGAGIAVGARPPYGKVDGNELKAALTKVLSSPSYAENARKLGATLSAAGGVQCAADEIQAFGRKVKTGVS
jgi:MGT family glycosyltransferase